MSSSGSGNYRSILLPGGNRWSGGYRLVLRGLSPPDGWTGGWDRACQYRLVSTPYHLEAMFSLGDPRPTRRQTLRVRLSAGRRIHDRTVLELNADQLRSIGIEVPQDLSSSDCAELVLQLHDELVVKVDDEEGAVDSAKEVLEIEMAAAFTAWLVRRQRPDSWMHSRADLGGCEELT
jgi:hypothetical protein